MFRGWGLGWEGRQRLQQRPVPCCTPSPVLLRLCASAQVRGLKKALRAGGGGTGHQAKLGSNPNSPIHQVHVGG